MNSLRSSTPWVIGSLTTLLAIVVWGQSFRWHVVGLSPYLVFPVLGLVAFSLMWSHYVVGFLKRTWFSDSDFPKYFQLTGWIVLALILLHPGILIYQRFRDGYGLPPHSYESYVAPGLAWVTILGSLSLVAFLAFELKRWFEDRGWWKYVLYVNDVAMLAIFYHGLRLGTQTHIAWYRGIWWFYGLSLVAILLFTYLTTKPRPQ